LLLLGSMGTCCEQPASSLVVSGRRLKWASYFYPGAAHPRPTDFK
jgi:hypothetical protein